MSWWIWILYWKQTWRKIGSSLRYMTVNCRTVAGTVFFNDKSHQSQTQYIGFRDFVTCLFRLIFCLKIYYSMYSEDTIRLNFVTLRNTCDHVIWNGSASFNLFLVDVFLASDFDVIDPHSCLSWGQMTDIILKQATTHRLIELRFVHDSWTSTDIMWLCFIIAVSSFVASIMGPWPTRSLCPLESSCSLFLVRVDRVPCIKVRRMAI